MNILNFWRLKVQFLKANKMLLYLGFDALQSLMAVPLELKSFPFSVWSKIHNKYLTDLIFLRTVSYVNSCFPLDLWPKREALGP